MTSSQTDKFYNFGGLSRTLRNEGPRGAKILILVRLGCIYLGIDYRKKISIKDSRDTTMATKIVSKKAEERQVT